MIDIIIAFISAFIFTFLFIVLFYFYYQYRKKVKRLDDLKVKIAEAKAMKGPDRKTRDSMNELLRSYEEYNKELLELKKRLETIDDEDPEKKRQMDEVEERLAKLHSEESQLLHAKEILESKT
jgi:septal ring factor EnvC (AmiA/AmiB activator)